MLVASLRAKAMARECVYDAILLKRENYWLAFPIYGSYCAF